MPPKVRRLHESLMTATDGEVACDAVDGLTRHARKGDKEAKASLAKYMIEGALDHVREFACSSLAEFVDQSDRELAQQFERGLSDDETRYWSIAGYARILGQESCEKLVSIALDTSLSTETRGQAVKCLAACSGQAFDRQLPSDPDEWEESDIRTDEIVAWSKAGCPDGTGHASPARHPALDNPKSKLEKAASRLEKRLAKQRGKSQDADDTSGRLVVADTDDIEQVTSRWRLPALYLDFLTRFSPVNVTLETKRFPNSGLQLFGAAELIEAQEGYAFDPVKKKAIRSWPKEYLVIASHGGDPFVLDLTSSNGTDATVLTAQHGTGTWEFVEEADSFEQFLKSLTK